MVYPRPTDFVSSCGIALKTGIPVRRETVDARTLLRSELEKSQKFRRNHTAWTAGRYLPRQRQTRQPPPGDRDQARVAHRSVNRASVFAAKPARQVPIRPAALWMLPAQR